MQQAIRVFISYKREDQPAAERLRSFLRAAGCRTWLDVDDIPKGLQPDSTGWDSAIHDGMKASPVVVGLMTPESLASKNVLDELGWAETNHRGLFLLHIRRVKEEDIPPRYIRLQRIDCLTDEQRGFEELRGELEDWGQRHQDFDTRINPPAAEKEAPPEVPAYLTAAPRKGRIYWPLILRVIGILIFIISVIWVIAAPAYDALIGFLTAFAALAGSTYQPGGESDIGKLSDYQEMRRRVYQYWVQGVMHTALADVKQVGIGLSDQPEAVAQVKDLGDIGLRDSGSIRRIFDTLKSFLILGEPGAGKTIMLLQLSESLILNPTPSNRNAVPLVLNLSSWSLSRKPLDEWLADEAYRTYRLRTEVVKYWRENHDLILLLDGLDEVKEEARRDCAAAINDFHRQNPSIPVVVCCRVKDYEAIVQDEDRYKLDMSDAVVLKALTPEQINVYLNDPELAHLRNVIAEDPTLQEMTCVPFLLNTMIYAYRHEPEAALRGFSTPAARRQHLFDTYFERRLSDNPLPRPYTKEKARKYLEWLATKMQAYVQTVFHVEDIQGYWLADDSKVFWRYQKLTEIPVGGWMGMVFGAVGWLAAGVVGALSFGGLGVLLGLLIKTSLISDEVQPAENARRFRIWKVARKHRYLRAFDFILVLILAVVVVIVSGITLMFPNQAAVGMSIVGAAITGWFLFTDREAGINRAPWLALLIATSLLVFGVFWSLVHVMGLGIWIGVAVGVLLAGTLITRAVIIRAVKPAEFTSPGRSRFADGALLIFLAAAGIGALLLSLFSHSLPLALILALLSTGFVFQGGVGLLERVALRRVLRLHRLPRDTVAFLNFMAERNMLRAMGGGHMFIHRYLLENFASLDEITVLLSQLGAFQDPEPVIQALQRIGERAVEWLINALSDEKVWVRGSAAEALGRLGDARAVEPLFTLLSDTDDWVRLSTVEALGRLGDARAVEPLFTLLSKGGHLDRLNAALALAQLGDARAVEPLIAAFSNTRGLDWNVVASALRKIGTPEALDALRKKDYDG